MSDGARLSLRSGRYYRGRALLERMRLTVARNRPPQGSFVRVLAYHRITSETDFLAVRPDTFRAQLEIALEQLQPMRLRRAIELLGSGEPWEGRSFCVTFDDGYHDNLEVALPILEQLRIPATIFLPTEIISGRETYHWYESPPRALSWDEARAAVTAGLVTFEPHSRTHRALPRLTERDLRSELVGSREALEQELGDSATVFCYPAGLYGDREAAMVRECGYRAAVTTDPGVNRPGDDLFRLRRTVIGWSDTPASFGRKLAGALDQPSPLEARVRAHRARGCRT